MNTSKAAAIRGVLGQLGLNASPKEIVQRLKAEGIDITPQQVSNEKARMATSEAPSEVPLSLLKKVKALVDEAGSVDLVRRALDGLEELTT